jgi:peptidoglycan/LPS O-acetylase OafA/YrhL
MTSDRRLDIQGLRALAVSLVVAFHAGLPIRSGFVGVDVFFVISGFVIGSLLLRELAASGSIDFARFYARRVRRLLPALTVMAIVVTALSTLLQSPFGPQQATARTAIGAALFAANVALFRSDSGYFDVAASDNALLHTWSLSLEEQFYFIFPAALLFGWQVARGSRRALVSLLAIATCASLAFALWMASGHGGLLANTLGGGHDDLAFYLPMTRVWEFAIGGLIALRPFSKLPRWLAEVIALAGLAAVVSSAILLDPTSPFPGANALWPVLGTAALIASGQHPTSISKLMSTRLLVRVGDLSYAWYLWHWPAIVFAARFWPQSNSAEIIAGFLSLVPALISYHFIEERFRADDRIVGRRAVGLLAVCIMAAVSTALLAGQVTEHESRLAKLAPIRSALEPHADVTLGCETAPCVWPSASPARGTIALVGDSFAGQLTEAVVAAGHQMGYDVTATVHSGCPFVDLDSTRPRRDTSMCREAVAQTMKSLLERKPRLVVIASHASGYINDARTRFFDEQGNVVREPAEKATLWERGLRSLLKRLADEKIAVLVVHEPPAIRGFSLVTCPFLHMLDSSSACNAAAPLSEIVVQRAHGRQADERAAAGVAMTVDLSSALCPTATCSAYRDGIWIYRDEHISVAATALIVESLRAAMAARL